MRTGIVIACLSVSAAAQSNVADEMKTALFSGYATGLKNAFARDVRIDAVASKPGLTLEVCR